jgi:superkiller protein 3
MAKIRPHLIEISLFMVVILLLTVGSYSRNRVWKDEISLCTDGVKKSPRKGRAYVHLAAAYFSAGMYDKSLETNQRAIQIDPKCADAYYNLGLTYQKMGDLNSAIAMEKKSLEVDPTLYAVYSSLGGIYFEKGQYQEAQEAFQKFLEVYPYFPEVHALLAITYAAQKKFNKAVIELEWELKINPYHVLAHLNVGQIYWYEFQNKQKAIYHLKTALMLDPYFPRRGEIRKLVRLLEGLP